MIDIAFLGSVVEQTLNNEIISQINNGNTILDNERATYRFRVYTDAGDYKAFDYLVAGMTPEQVDEGAISIEQTNKIVRYINCSLATTGSQIEGAQSVEMALNTRFEVLIPLASSLAEKKRLELVSTIRQVMDNAFRLNSSGTLQTEDDIEYNYGVVFQLADTGERAKRQEIGDSILLSALLTFFIVQSGVNSEDFSLYIDGELVPFTTIGFSRVAQSESNIPNNTTNIAGKNTPTSRVFGINFAMPFRKGNLGYLLDNATFTGVNLAHMVRIERPTGTPNSYLMIIDDVRINGEKTKFASVYVVLAEADATVPLSTYAQENWQNG